LPRSNVCSTRDLENPSASVHLKRFSTPSLTLKFLCAGKLNPRLLKPGWMNRYLPPVALEVVPDIATIFGFVWSGLMFFSAVLNLIVALNFSVQTWASFMTIYGIVSKLSLFMTQYATMRLIGVLRRARMTPARLEGG
jgi:hypothetical protein